MVATYDPKAFVADTGTYDPSAFMPDTAAPSNQGLLGSAASAIAPIAAGANEFAGGSLSGLGSILSSARSALGSVAPPQLAGIPQPSLSSASYNPGQALQNIGNAITANAPTNYNGNQPTLTQQAIEGAAHYAPYVPQALDSGISGAKGIANWISGASHDSVAQGLYDQLSGGAASKTDLNAANNADVIQNTQNQIDKSTAAYKGFGNDIAGRGYATSGTPGTAGLDISAPGKFIKPQATTNTIIDNGAVNDPNSQASQLFSNVSSDTQGMINNYNSSPTFNNAHLLQSQLGKEAANIRAGLNTNIPDATQAKTITSAQKALQSDIHSTFNANGDTDLSDQYTQLGQDYKNNVVPSMNVPQIWRAYNKPESAPANIASVLSKPSANRQTILQQLSTNSPQTINSLVAQAIPNVGKFDQYGNSTTNAENVLKGYANLPSSLKNVMPAETNGALQQLQSASKLRNTLLKGAAATTGLATAAGTVYGAHKLL